jgi:hypothetical protein
MSKSRLEKQVAMEKLAAKLRRAGYQVEFAYVGKRICAVLIERA